MILRLLFVLLLSVLTACSSGYFHLSHGDRSAGNPPAAPTNLTKDTKARLKVLSSVIKEQQMIIDRYNKQATAKKQDPLYFVTDQEYLEAKTRLQKAQAEAATPGG